MPLSLAAASAAAAAAAAAGGTGCLVCRCLPQALRDGLLSRARRPRVGDGPAPSRASGPAASGEKGAGNRADPLRSPLPELASLRCPITQEIMQNPVTAADGQVYEEEAITTWLQHKRTSPMTNLPLESCNVSENRILKRVIEEYHEHRSELERRESERVDLELKMKTQKAEAMNVQESAVHSLQAALEEKRSEIEALQFHCDELQREVRARRTEIVIEMFRMLDETLTGHLGTPQLRRYAQLCGFDGDSREWAREYRALALSYGWNLDEGVSLANFTRMVDHREGSGFCSDEELEALITELKKKGLQGLDSEWALRDSTKFRVRHRISRLLRTKWPRAAR